MKNGGKKKKINLKNFSNFLFYFIFFESHGKQHDGRKRKRINLLTAQRNA